MTTTFPWSTIGHDRPMSIEIDEICNTLRTGYGAGYIATRARTTKMQKRFNIEWQVMENANWIALLTFWRSVHGSADAFYFEYPEEFYDSGGYGGYDLGDEPADGFDGTTYGSGSVFLVRFANDNMPQKVLVNKGTYWGVSLSLQEVI